MAEVPDGPCSVAKLAPWPPRAEILIFEGPTSAEGALNALVKTLADFKVTHYQRLPGFR